MIDLKRKHCCRTRLIEHLENCPGIKWTVIWLWEVRSRVYSNKLMLTFVESKVKEHTTALWTKFVNILSGSRQVNTPSPLKMSVYFPNESLHFENSKDARQVGALMHDSSK